MSGDPIRYSITGFYQKINEAHETLENEGRTIEDRKGNLLNLLETGIQFPELPDGQGEYQDLCRAVMNEAKQHISGWREMIQSQIERSEFVNRHEKSVLVLVFADVNAGKSTLGNFISGYNLQGTPYEDLWRKDTKFEVEDFSEASKEDRNVRTIECFAENAVEATSTIQHFTLMDGLTWVDTPGLHSLTVEHGELAREYVQFADLVVYLTPSSSPFKTDEREMLADLFRRGKPVILAVTKSDVTKRQVVQGRIVNIRQAKSQEVRKSQEDYVAGEARKLGGEGLLKNSSFLSLSVRLAREAMKNQDFALWKDSNLPQFFLQVGDLLSCEAMELKMQRPKAEVNDCIDSLTGTNSDISENDTASIFQIRGVLSDKIRELRELSDKCAKAAPLIRLEIEQQLPYAMDAPFRSLRSQRQLENAEAVRRETEQVVRKLTSDVCEKHLKRILGDAVRAAQFPELTVSAASHVKYQTTTRERTVLHREERSPHGIFENIHHFLDPNVKFYKDYHDTEYVEIGDNYNSFLDAQIQALRPELERCTDEAVKQIVDSCIRPVQECYLNLDRQLEKLAESLRSQRFA